MPGVRAHQESRVPALCALAGSVDAVPGTDRGEAFTGVVISRPKDTPPLTSSRKPMSVRDDADVKNDGLGGFAFEMRLRLPPVGTLIV